MYIVQNVSYYRLCYFMSEREGERERDQTGFKFHISGWIPHFNLRVLTSNDITIKNC